ncbi:MAG: isocitrate dehydrogenase [Flavobacteriales bacterium]|nr:isocitrate dehydrogenase [Flavobacteriales bacterium]
MTVSIAKGDGIGPEIMDAVISIFDAAGVSLNYDFVGMGKSYYDKGFSTGMTPEAMESIETNGILFKGPMETPKGQGVKSINVTARKIWSTYANRRHFVTIPGVETVYSKAGIPIDITVIRENIEDTYGGIEHMESNDVALSRRFITRQGCQQVVKFAFEMARKEGFKKVACGHKANIMKLTDGLFLEVFYEIAKNYPEIEVSDIIVDALCMKLVQRPQDFEVVVLTNLQGDIVSDLCAGLVGGLGFAPSTNVGECISIFEAVHGTAPDIAGKNIANPTSLLLSGIMMLRHVGLLKEAANIEAALFYTIEQGQHTGDFGNRNSAALSTTEFANAIINNLGKQPSNKVMRETDDFAEYHKPHRPQKQKVMVGEPFTSEIEGIDIFFQSEKHAEDLAVAIKALLPDYLQLISITNRGTVVWPGGSLFTECSTGYGARIMGKNVNKTAYWNFVSHLNQALDVSSTEFLYLINNKRAYSLGQGQIG